MVNKYVSLNSVSKVLNIDLAQLTILNPSYKRMIVNGSASAPKRLVIPQAAKEKYSALYDALNAEMSYNDLHESTSSYANDEPVRRKTRSHHKTTNATHNKAGKDYVTYKVHRGDTLKVIADKFDGTTVAEIKELNGLKDSRLQPGMTLKINKG